MQFEFATANRIVFGPGSVVRAGEIAAEYGTDALVVTGSHVGRAAPLFESLEANAVRYEHFSVSAEPTIEIVEEGRKRAHDFGCQMVISFGGGSPLDAGKAIAGLLTNGGQVLDYLEVIGQGRTLQKAAAPFLAIPTTAGPGTEVTRNAVLKSTERRVKVSMRSPLLLPKVALIDPELTCSLPPGITAGTGLDAFTQALEGYVSNKANPMTDTTCREAMARTARSLRRACEDGGDLSAREDMCLASLFGGLAVANAKLGAVHGFAGPAGGMFPVPHGVVCARLLPFVMEANVRALQTRDPESPVLHRYDDVARILTGDASATSADGVTWVQHLCDALHIPALSEYGMTQKDIPLLVENAARASSMQGNPIVLTPEELSRILEQAL
ncbi:alcohol dehydrogenase [candidate division KSB3 bacterium]|uniref:Alcohol dehydrogenase n=1 Tax=candidate division KSB3 bacterium TaxID=2044937 RepID=A0A2G6E7P2_9BACT|nr:MAG: alcohol dehydrogenase [candidate division KSB3 bacterium]PIE30314.1 MAG: alcohol dehydrogenase [candidate division KSB3 bacterium]